MMDIMNLWARLSPKKKAFYEICKTIRHYSGGLPNRRAAELYDSLVLMLVGLQLHIIPLSEVKETSTFLIEIMPLMFIPAAVGLITSFDILKAHLAAYLVITAVSTFLVMLVSGHVTQLVIRRKGGKA